MTYDIRERSANNGEPIDLYTFSRGDHIKWYYTSADRDLLVDGQLYTAATIGRGPIQQGSEAQRSNQRLNVPDTHPIAALYNVAPPSDPITLVLRQYHYGDTDIATLWQGEIAGVSFDDGDEAVIELIPSTSADAMGLRRCYQRSCPFVLYGPDCALDPATFRTTDNVAAVYGLAIVVPSADAQPDGFFDGGFLEWEVATDTYERRFIHTHLGDVLTVDMEPLGLVATMEVRIYPGCDHSLATCTNKFSNTLNYGGMPYIPLKNPFGSDPIF